LPQKLAAIKKTVQNIVTIWLHEGRIELNKPTGRKRKTTEDDDKNIVAAEILYKFKSVSQIMDIFLQEFNLPITETILYKRLRENGLRSRIMAKKPKLTQDIKQKRIEIANEYLMFNNDIWLKTYILDQFSIQTEPSGQFRLFRGKISFII